VRRARLRSRPCRSIDPPTVYLATSPGGNASVAINAASSTADLSFVMAPQTVRFAIVLIGGHPLARFIAQRTGRGPPSSRMTRGNT
jgi:uncharacterized membrane protein AbrB (regulator of aidB expression)